MINASWTMQDRGEHRVVLTSVPGDERPVVAALSIDGVRINLDRAELAKLSVTATRILTDADENWFM